MTVDPISQGEFHEDSLDVCLDRALAEVQLFGDLAVGQSVSDVYEDLAFPVGEAAEVAVADVGGVPARCRCGAAGVRRKLLRISLA